MQSQDSDQQADPVDPQLRLVEREIDEAYRSNPLTKLTFGEAAWYFFAFCEELAVRPFVQHAARIQEQTGHDAAALADALMNHSKWPLRWLRKVCTDSDRLPGAYDQNAYSASQKLSELAFRYTSFEGAFTYASLGLLQLRLEETHIVPSDHLRKDLRFEAYDRLVNLSEKGPFVDLEPLFLKLAHSVRVKDDLFLYPLNPKLVKETLEEFGPILDARFKLPPHWQFSGYTLAEFTEVAKTLWALSAIHFTARLSAAVNGCSGLGYSRALLLMREDELKHRIARYTKLAPERIKAVLDDLTYGSGNLRLPDPALQPLIRLTPTVIGWPPNLILNNALERNLIVLTNRMPERRQLYSRISQEKEQRLRARIQNRLEEFKLRSWYGTVSGWKDNIDIDLAIVSDPEKHCLILELKSFIEPAEPREIRDRSEEISRGVAQIRERKRLAAIEPAALHDCLQVDRAYTFSWAVASETSIGQASVQDESVPVINASHLLERLRRVRQLGLLSKWLETGEYLPVRGRDYEVIEQAVKIERWTLDWYGIKGIREDWL